jgi:O-antigen ligase
MGGGLVVMAVALLLTGARGAALALLAGLLTAGCLWAALKRARWLALVIVGLAVMSGGGLLALSQINWATSPLAQLPLLARLNPGVMDSPRISRELTWANALRISREWPGMVDVWGEADRYRTLRPWLGYGLETFEFVHRPLVSAALLAHEGGRPIDRAHNDWLDALVTLGWFGLAARLLLWGAAWWVGLGRLGLRRMPVFILAAVGALIGIGVAGASPYLPVIVTAGGLVGIWAGVLINSLFVTPPSQWSTQHTALLTALAILTAHLVDLQFSFTTVAAGWPAWLAVGLLLRARTQPAQMD